MPESQNIEWKSKWKDEYLEWICGYANAQGGKLYIGCDDEGNAVGLPNARGLMEDIPNKIRDALGIIVGVNLLEKDGRKEKQRILRESLHLQKVKFYSLQGCRDFFYGLMAPSTGYIPYFQLMKYRRGVLLRFPHPTAPDRIPPYEDEKKLYQAFGEQTRWDQLLDVNYVADLNEKIDNGQYRELIQISEALHEKKIAEIADKIKRQHKRIVLIAGPSSSGKTTFARRLCIQLKVNGLDPLYMGTDDYFLEREDTPLDENGEKDFDVLESLDLELFRRQLSDLTAGKSVHLAVHDFKEKSTSFREEPSRMDADTILIIEGIHGLNPQLTAGFDESMIFRIYISALTQINLDTRSRISTTDNRILRRMIRDSRTRGISPTETLSRWPSVERGEKNNIFPFQNNADSMINSALSYELAALVPYAVPRLRSVRKESGEPYIVARRLLAFLDLILPMPDDMIPPDSILREFIGGSLLDVG